VALTDRPGPFGILLQQYRAAAGLSQEELAARAGLSRRGISDLERGERRLPHPATVRRLTEALNLDDAERANLLASIHSAPPPDNSPGRVVQAHLAPPPAAPRRKHGGSAAASTPPALVSLAPSSDTPRPTAMPARRRSLPASLSSFVGRDHELTELASALETTRLLTLTGPGGVGKTRLGLQLAQLLESRFSDGATFVALAAIQDAALVVPTIAQILGNERDGARAPGEVAEALLDKHLLLILDNFEHVIGAAPAITELLEACAGVKVLVTSRAPLRVRGEQEFAVPPLRLPAHGPSPDPIALLSQYDAVRLFVERARSVEPHFTLTDLNAAAVVEICRRMDGLPLAIELAAAHIRLLSPQAMLSRMEQRSMVLSGGARDLPARQQTLRATIAWSYDLLGLAEQKLFQRLSIFVGGFTMAAARSVAGGNKPSGAVPAEHEHAPRPTAVAALDVDTLQLLESLVAMSMVQTEGRPDGEQRFSMLATIQEFGLECLADSGEEGALRRRHASAYLTFAERAKQELSGPDQGVWLARLEAEHGNLRAAFDTCVANRETERAARFLEALHWFWLVHGHLTEGGERATRVASLAAATDRPELRALALDHASALAFHLSDYAAACTLAEQSLAIRRTQADLSSLPSVLVLLAAAELRHGEPGVARAHLEESMAIARQIGDVVSYSRSVIDLANLAHEQADYAVAYSLYHESLALAREMDDTLGEATVLNNLAVVARDRGDGDEACRLFQASIQIRRAIGDRHGLGLTLANLADVVTQFGDYHRARTLLTESLAIEYDLGAGPSIAFVLERMAGLAAAQAQLGQRLGQARRALDDAAVAQAWDEGKELSLDEAIASALAGTDDL
jgi:predicted ATPase/transcriptional regulator with XRE-family HTH domain